MSATAGEYPLHDCLKQFLSNADVKYVPVTARLVSLSPAQLTQDDERFLEAQSFTKDLLGKDSRLSKTDLAREKVFIRLADWKFVISRIPNSSDYYLDIDVKSFEFVPSAQPRGSELVSRQLINILETNPYSRFFEETTRRLMKHREEDGDKLAGHGGRGLLQSKAGQKFDEGSNQNKYSFRPRYSNPNQLTPRESANEGPKKSGDGESGVRQQTPGIRVSGINGRQNMKKLKDFKQSYNTASQESITHQIMGPDRQESQPINGNKHDEAPLKIKERPIYLKKRSYEDEDILRQKSNTILEETKTKNNQPIEKTKHGISLGIFDSSQTQKKLKVPQRFEYQTGESFDDGLNYDELMECLSLERGLVHWEDLIFSKDVVKFLKHHISDLLDKK